MKTTNAFQRENIVQSRTKNHTQGNYFDQTLNYASAYYATTKRMTGQTEVPK